MNRREVLLAAAAGALHVGIPGQADDAPSVTPPESSDDLAELTLAEASGQIRRGAITSRDLTLACLERTAAQNLRLNAFITVMREQALAQATALDAEAQANRFRSPLHGIPVALKDTIDTAGTRTTAGSAIFEDRVPTVDAHVVHRLRQAGAVIFAKANFVEEGLAIIAGLTRGLKDVTLPPETESHDIIINLAEILSYHQELLEQQARRYMPATRKILQWCAGYLEDPDQGTSTAKLARYIKAREEIARLRRIIDTAFTDFDVLVIPTMKGLPPTIEAALQAESGGQPEDPPLVSIDNTIVANRLGLPALTLPCGFSTEGLPIGLMMCGPRFSEGRLLALGAAYERSTEWHRRRPTRLT